MSWILGEHNDKKLAELEEKVRRAKALHTQAEGNLAGLKAAIEELKKNRQKSQANKKLRKVRTAFTADQDDKNHKTLTTSSLQDKVESMRSSPNLKSGEVCAVARFYVSECKHFSRKFLEDGEIAPECPACHKPTEWVPQSERITVFKKQDTRARL